MGQNVSDVAWAAGLFEGEGSIITENGKRVAGLTMGSADRDVLDRFASVVGGRVWGPYQGQGRNTPAHYRPMYQWGIHGVRQIQPVLRAFWPYLGDRRRARAAEAIASYYLSDRPRLPQRRNHRALSVEV